MCSKFPSKNLSFLIVHNCICANTLWSSARRRKDRTKDHPWTPPKRTKYSRRAWDGLVRVWRKKLHCWDPAGLKDEHAADIMDDSDTETAEESKPEPLGSASPPQI